MFPFFLVNKGDNRLRLALDRSDSKGTLQLANDCQIPRHSMYGTFIYVHP